MSILKSLNSKFKLLAQTHLRVALLLTVFSFCLHPSVLATKLELGIDVLEANQFSILKGKRVGLLTHPAGVNRHGESTLSVFQRSPAVNCVALFGPEHGIYGNEKANQPIDNQIDSQTGLPIYSLYGRYRRPQAEMLANIDCLVIDLQDIGVRSYTYVSSMLYSMEACFENGVEVVVLDRPNPLGGIKTDGPMLEATWKSYVGAFPIPYVHGLTIGELAVLAKSMPNWMSIDASLQKRGRLKVVPMHGWKRSMLWPDTGLPWIPTSPNIPSFASVLGYAMTGLGAQEGDFSHGIGTAYPFRLLSHPLLSSKQLLRRLKAYEIKGLAYQIIETENAKGRPVRGVYVGVERWQNCQPTELSFYMMDCLWSIEPANPFSESKNPALFNKHVGSSHWWQELTQNVQRPRVKHFLKQWKSDRNRFRKSVQNYLIYN